MAYTISSLHVGQIILVTEAHRCNPLDWIIQWSEDSPFNHAALVVRDEHGDLCLAEALWHIQYADRDKYVSNGWAFTVAGWMPDKSAILTPYLPSLGDLVTASGTPAMPQVSEMYAQAPALQTSAANYAQWLAELGL